MADDIGSRGRSLPRLRFVPRLRTSRRMSVPGWREVAWPRCGALGPY